MLNRQTQSTILQCTHCHETMQLVRHIDITELPEIFVFFCSACQRAKLSSKIVLPGIAAAHASADGRAARAPLNGTRGRPTTDIALIEA